MEDREFLEWLSGIGKLTGAQRLGALAALSEAGRFVTDARPDPDAAVEGTAAGTGAGASAVEPARGVRGGRVVAGALAEIGHHKVESQGCPHCGGRVLGGWGHKNGMPRYRCKGCGRTFNALTKTPMARLRKKERWLENAQAMIEGTSVAMTALRCEVDYTTAFRWRHRFLGSPASDKPETLTGLVEADETFILESFKGRRSGLTRPARKRGGKAKHPGLFFENIPVLVARDRYGATIDAVLPNDDGASITAALEGVVTPANRLICDGGKAIIAFARRAKIRVHVVPAPGNPRPGAPNIHINNVNAYHGRFKQWMRRFHGVATANLPNYLGWRRALEAWGNQASAENWIHGTIGMGPYNT
jgi:transposase-like protein